MVSFPSSTPPPPAWSAEANQKTIRLRWNQQKMCPGWWFQTFFIFHNIWDTPSHWLICFNMVKTPTQSVFCFPDFKLMCDSQIDANNLVDVRASEGSKYSVHGFITSNHNWEASPCTYV
jgi:hypothetical protein